MQEPARSGFAPSALVTDLKATFRGRTVWLLADCCYSGALGDAARALGEAGVEAVSLTSAEAANVSPNSWTFTQSVLEALAGAPTADRNGDGAIVLSELEDEVADAMMYLEKQRFGHHRPSSCGDWVLATTRGAARPGAGRYVLANHPSGPRPARVLEAGPTDSLVRFYNYSETEERRLPNAELEAITFKRYPAEASVRVYWGGKLWPARILRTDGDFHWITYPGWPSYWDEWVLGDRIADESAPADSALRRGMAASVQWHGTWYPARVLEVQGSRFLIHYDGYDSSWDEWVDRRRIRPR